MHAQKTKPSIGVSVPDYPAGWGGGAYTFRVILTLRSPEQWGVVKILFLLALPKTGTVELNWSMNLLQIKNSFHLCAHIKIQHKEGKEIA